MKRIILLLAIFAVIGGYSKETIDYKKENLFKEGLKQEKKSLEEIKDILNKKKLADYKKEQEELLKIEKKKKIESKKKKVVKSKKQTTAKKKTTKKKKVTTMKVVGYSTSELQNYAYSLVMSYGWSESDYNSLIKLWNRESSWNPNAINKKSGACGIPQSLPCSKMASAGSDYRTNGHTQIRWGLSYIKSRYGSPNKAWQHSQRTGWY